MLSWYHLRSPCASRQPAFSSRLYSYPVTGATGKVLLSRCDFFLQLRVLFAVRLHAGFPPTARSLYATHTATRPISALSYSFVCTVTIAERGRACQVDFSGELLLLKLYY